MQAYIMPLNAYTANFISTALSKFPARMAFHLPPALIVERVRIIAHDNVTYSIILQNAAPP